MLTCGFGCEARIWKFDSSTVGPTDPSVVGLVGTLGIHCWLWYIHCSHDISIL